MSDKELLELAAKAAGIKIYDPTLFVNGRYMVRMPHGFSDYWNPLTDDGDALRLAVKLGITIDMHDCCAWSRGHLGMIQEFWGGDFDLCYRRAIVRAAAEIGKAMP
jgi:hypothetical protein